MDASDDPSEARGPRRLYRPQVLPTLLTMGNLFCGFLAIAFCVDAMTIDAGSGHEALRNERLGYAGWLIFLGMIFDALDGSVARLAGGTSTLGAQLDSLADMVSFGAAPALLAKCLAEGPGGMENHKLTLYFSAFFVLMAGLRLARYNSKHGDPEEAHLWFEGLPTPGAAGVIAGLAVVLPDPYFAHHGAALGALPWATLLLGIFMVSRLPFAHFVNRFLKGRKPIHYLVVATAVLVLCLAFHSFAIVLASSLLAYALSGPVMGLVRLRGDRRAVRAKVGGKAEA
jgi:CDP-diacylglycerol--serine O-phosphatidyltransferase